MDIPDCEGGLTLGQRITKRSFDFIGALVGLLLTWPLMLIVYVIASISTNRSGLFRQKRVGRNGRFFHVCKFRTMRSDLGPHTYVTTEHDPRITGFGRFLRKTKLDELPQLLNILLGQMSFVGPRPDVLGYADRLEEKDCIILSVRPGVTGPATLYFRNEERLLAEQSDPEKYNDEVIWPEKVRINREYVRNYNFWRDLGYIWNTLFGIGTDTARNHSQTKK